MSESTTMELELIKPESAIVVFTGGGLGAILDRIEATVRAIPLDCSTAAGRDHERNKIAAEQKAAEDARLKREADVKHKAKIHLEIAEDLCEFDGEDTAEQIADAIMEGKIRNIKVIF